ncbi:MAG: hypothetical protein ABSG80_15245, partial [Verrucomicrobiota bacterium]
QPFGEEQRLGPVQSGTMIHACIRPPSGVNVSNHVPLFTQPLAGANGHRRFSFDGQMKLEHHDCKRESGSRGRGSALDRWPAERSDMSKISLISVKI